MGADIPNNSEMISKRELLDLTGISYGQLYRWKRERLIPDAWFIKKSSFTGQETFFPKQQVTERIRFILKHKDTCSLPQIASMLIPSVTNRSYDVGSSCLQEIIPRHILDKAGETCQHELLSPAEILIVYAASRLVAENRCPQSLADAIITVIPEWVAAMNHFSYTIKVLLSGGSHSAILSSIDTVFYTDSDTKIIYELELEPLMQQLREKLEVLSRQKSDAERNLI